MDELNEKLEETPIYRYSVSNTTPEALEQIAFNQTGLWNVVSDEAGAINVLLGNMYSEGSLSNADIILQAWDGDWLSSSRITRKAGEGYVRGSYLCCCTRRNYHDNFTSRIKRETALVKGFYCCVKITN